MFVGLVIEKDSPSGLNIFELCQDGKCVEAGSVGTFGEKRKKGQDYAGSRPPPINNETFFIRDTDVTEIVDKQGWTLKKPLTARMKKSVVPNLPEPVMIYHDLGKDGDIDKEDKTIVLNPEETVRKYGDLISEYEEGDQIIKLKNAEE